MQPATELVEGSNLTSFTGEDREAGNYQRILPVRQMALSSASSCNSKEDFGHLRPAGPTGSADKAPPPSVSPEDGASRRPRVGLLAEEANILNSQEAS